MTRTDDHLERTQLPVQTSDRRARLVRRWTETVLSDLCEAEDRLHDLLATFRQPYPPSSPLPFLCPAWVRAACMQISPSISRAVDAITEQWLSSESLRVEIPLPSHLSGVFPVSNLADRMPPSTHPVIRVDAFIDFDNRSLKILEFNTADPSAFAWNDWMLAATNALPGVRALLEGEKFVYDEILPKHIDMVTAHYSAYCRARGIVRKPNPLIVLLMDESSSVYFDCCCLERMLRAKGNRAVLASPEDLRLLGTKVVCNGLPVDIIIRDTLDDVWNPLRGVVAPAAATILTQQFACVVNPLLSTVGDQKAIMPVLKRQLENDAWSAKHGIDNRTLLRWLPETVLLNVEKRDTILSKKDDWVIKPSFGYGGHEVFPGVDHDFAKWSELVNSLSNSSRTFVAQRYVPAGSGELPSVQDGEIRIKRVNANYSFWIIDGAFAGAFVRLSDRTVINTHQGGALVPVYYYS